MPKVVQQSILVLSRTLLGLFFVVVGLDGFFNFI
jgi:hypothetical protein